MNPRVSSKWLTAFTSPMLPSLIRSSNDRERPWYCLATLTTKRKLARTSLSLARSASAPFPWSLRPSSASSSGLIIRSRDISLRYTPSPLETRLVNLLVIFSSLMLVSSDKVSSAAKVTKNLLKAAKCAFSSVKNTKQRGWRERKRRNKMELKIAKTVE